MQEKYGKGTRIRKTAGDTEDDRAKKKLECSSTTSNAVLRAELVMYPLETNRDVRKLK